MTTSPVPTVALLLAGLTAFSLTAADPVPDPIPPTPQDQQRIAWWQQARFGMFIHWGLYSIPAKGEWRVFSSQIDYSEYAKLSDQFTAEKFDPDAWAAAAKGAGMGYMVLTARHHDGFSLWDSPASFEQFTSMHSAAKKDFVADYTKACRKAGLGVGLYYSPLDWRFPGFFFPKMYRKNAEAMRDQTYAQVQELLTNYGKIDLLWYDGGGDNWLGFGGLEWGGAAKGWDRRPKNKPYDGKPLWEPEKLQAIVRRLQPDIITNDRSGTPGDFGSREAKIGDFDNQRPWEKCGTLNGNWGYTPAPAHSLAVVIGELSNTVCRDGNFLLNVGPRADGSIDPDHLQRLGDIGAWMKVNGSAVHGTRGGPLPPTEFYGTTFRDDAVYVHVWKWPTNGTLVLEKLPRNLVSGAVISGDKATIETTDGRVSIARVAAVDGAPMTVLKLTLDGPVR